MEPVQLAVQQVQSLAQRLDSPILAQLASKLSAATRYGDNPNDVFKSVRQMIADMITKLNKATQAEMTKKAFCKDEQAKTQTQRTQRASDLQDKITKLAAQNAAVASVQQDISDLTAQLTVLSKTLADLHKLYQDQNAQQAQEMQEAANNAQCLNGLIQAVREFFAIGKDVGVIQVDIGAAMKAAMTGQDPNSVVTNAVAARDSLSGGFSQMTPAEMQAATITKLEVVLYNLARKLADISSQAAITRASQGNQLNQVQEDVQGKTYLQTSKTTELSASKQTLQQYTTDRNNAQAQLDATDAYIQQLAQQCVPPTETPEQMQARITAEIKGLQSALLILQGNSQGATAATTTIASSTTTVAAR